MTKTFKLKVDDYCGAQSLHTSWKVWIILFGILLAVFYAFADIQLDDPVGLSVYGIVIGVILMVMPNSIKRKRKMDFYKHRELREEVTFEYDDSLVQWTGKSGSYRIKWNKIKKWKIGKGVILIYETDVLMRMIPMRIFDESEIDFIRSKLEKRDANQSLDTTPASAPR
ncbi:hypothetical protein VDG1235_3004 [Verrucomicrobiia bacterium DG1235]|nr:hypothetical protein VDG1235_3004 [Verrucomicrobiae bacterium DG1235]